MSKLVEVVIGLLYFALAYYFQDWIAAHQVWLLVLLLAYVHAIRGDLAPFSSLADKAGKVTASIDHDLFSLMSQMQELKLQLQDVQYELDKMRQGIDQIIANTEPTD